MGEKYTDEELLQGLRDLADELEETPKKAQMGEKGPYSRQIYNQRFGSWNEALREAGLEVETLREADDEKLLDAIRELAEELGRPPKVREMNELGPYAQPTYIRHFENWSEAVREAGYEPPERTRNADNEKLLQHLRELDGGINGPVRWTDMDEEGDYSPNTYVQRFGTWNAALDMADIEKSQGPTDIERRLYSILEEVSTHWDSEVSIGSYRADVLLQKQNVVIESEGYYWHGHPQTAPYDETQKSGMKNYVRKDQALNQSGYHVVRFWGTTIRERPDDVRQIIREIVEGDRLPEHGRHVFGPEPLADTKHIESSGE